MAGLLFCLPDRMKQYPLSSVVRAGVFGTLLGVGAGVLVGLLVAPSEGERTRRRLAYRLDQAAGSFGGLLEGLLNPATAPNEARETGDALVSDAEAEADRIRGEIDRLIRQQKQRSASDAS